jgi:hypothetical protein
MVSQLKFNKTKDGSLLDLFESPLFDIHMFLRYLHTQNKPHIIEYLMNKMYMEYRHDVKILDFYLPQLCFMAVSKRDREVSLSIERFILQISIKYQILGLKAL